MHVVFTIGRRLAVVTRPAAHVLTRRERTHAATLEEIKGTARRHLAEQGSAALNLRAVARDMGMTPSALYRYVDSRDALLTALIMESYDDVGQVVEAAAARLPAGMATVEGLLSVMAAFRRWALEQPHAWALLFGSPVPGYEAPPETLEHVMRTTGVLLDLLRRALPEHGARLSAVNGDLPPRLHAAMGGLTKEGFHGLTPIAAAVALAIWTTLLGAIAGELFTYLPPTDAADELFTFTMLRCLAGCGFELTGGPAQPEA